MVAATVDRALPLVLKDEKGQPDDPAKPAGGTNLGATIDTWSRCLG